MMGVVVAMVLGLACSPVNPAREAIEQAKAAEAARLAPTTAPYRCPMHPEITSTEPASCPLCGMPLEPVAPPPPADAPAPTLPESP